MSRSPRRYTFRSARAARYFPRDLSESRSAPRGALEHSGHPHRPARHRSWHAAMNSSEVMRATRPPGARSSIRTRARRGAPRRGASRDRPLGAGAPRRPPPPRVTGRATTSGVPRPGGASPLGSSGDPSSARWTIARATRAASAVVGGGDARSRTRGVGGRRVRRALIAPLPLRVRDELVRALGRDDALRRGGRRDGRIDASRARTRSGIPRGSSSSPSASPSDAGAP